MGKIIKVRCNGSNKHVNDVDMEKALRTTTVLRGAPVKDDRRIPERLVLPCQFCTAGKVILSREIIEENL